MVSHLSQTTPAAPRRRAAGACPAAAAKHRAARAAVVMPICNEDVQRVFAGLRATYESLAQTGALDRFDVFILSDSGRDPQIAAELNAYQTLRRAFGGAVKRCAPDSPSAHSTKR